MAKLVITFIRHGESEDNLKAIWAGWKDAPLSESKGIRTTLSRIDQSVTRNQQAQALGLSLSSTSLAHIYASPLKRAHSTALAVQEHQASPKAPLILSPHLREQHFGIAEGNKWVLQPPEDKSLEQLFSEGLFPVLYGRQEKFPEGECLDDLARRAEQGLRECVLPHLVDPVDGEGDISIALASHGLCIGELIAALVRLDPEAKKGKLYTGLMNTAWTRAEVRVRDGHGGPYDSASPPPLEVKITHINERTHLELLKKQGLPTQHEDVGGAQAEAKAKAYFGGAKA